MLALNVSDAEIIFIYYTLKPALATTCTERLPDYKEYIFCFPQIEIIIETCSKGTCT